MIEPVTPLTDEQVTRLIPVLVEAARADKQTAERFVAPRTGILEETAARRHQFIFGRRGVGKSTLLGKIESLSPSEQRDVIFVDIETLRHRPYPDVLIELLIEILSGLDERLRQKGGRLDLHRSRRKSRKEINQLTRTMRQLLNEPQIAERVVRQMQASDRSLRARAGIRKKVGMAGRTGGAFTWQLAADDIIRAQRCARDNEYCCLSCPDDPAAPIPQIPQVTQLPSWSARCGMKSRAAADWTRRT